MLSKVRPARARSRRPRSLIIVYERKQVLVDSLPFLGQIDRADPVPMPTGLELVVEVSTGSRVEEHALCIWVAAALFLGVVQVREKLVEVARFVQVFPLQDVSPNSWTSRTANLS